MGTAPGRILRQYTLEEPRPRTMRVLSQPEFIRVKGEYTDAAGNKIREMQALEVKEIQGFPTVTKSVLRDLRTGSSTTITYAKDQNNLGLAQDLFTERYLRNPPRAQLR